MTKNLAVGYPDMDEPLFHAPDIVLLRGETAALIGPNGVGKSTFLKTVIGELAPMNGEAEIGASVKVGYFAQAHERLNPKNSILDEILTIKSMPISEARNYLGRFLFSGDDVYRPIETLSGGERGRVALAKLALDGANLLLLDEPTNHLDIDSQEILQDVLNGFDGTIIIVSHDRYLIDALATQIWAANDGELIVFDGPYQEYITARNRRLELEAVNQSASLSRRVATSDSADNGDGQAQKSHGLNPYQLKKRLEEVEAQITTLEARMDDLHNAIAEASANGDATRVEELGTQYTQTQADLDAALHEWEQLAE